MGDRHLVAPEKWVGMEGCVNYGVDVDGPKLGNNVKQGWCDLLGGYGSDLLGIRRVKVVSSEVIYLISTVWKRVR